MHFRLFNVVALFTCLAAAGNPLDLLAQDVHSSTRDQRRQAINSKIDSVRSRHHALMDKVQKNISDKEMENLSGVNAAGGSVVIINGESFAVNDSVRIVSPQAEITVHGNGNQVIIENEEHENSATVIQQGEGNSARIIKGSAKRAKDYD